MAWVHLAWVAGKGRWSGDGAYILYADVRYALRVALLAVAAAKDAMVMEPAVE